jgi:hypothetical protein
LMAVQKLTNCCAIVSLPRRVRMRRCMQRLYRDSRALCIWHFLLSHLI